MKEMNAGKKNLKGWQRMPGLRKVIPVCVVCLALFYGTSIVKAGEGEQYIPAYNNLVKMVTDRCLAAGDSTNGLSQKNITSTNQTANSVTQSDLNNLRTNIIHLLTNHFVVASDYFNLGTNVLADAFPYALRYNTNGLMMANSLMEGIGSNGWFTAVPAGYTTDNNPIYTNNFTNVPVLWIHLDEMQQVLAKMKYTKKTGSWISKGENNAKNGSGYSDSLAGYNYSAVTSEAESSFSASAMSLNSGPHGMALYEGGVGIYNDPPETHYVLNAALCAQYAYFSISGLMTNISHITSFYNYSQSGGDIFESPSADINENCWTLFDNQTSSCSSSNVSKQLGSLSPPSWPAEDYSETFFHDRGYLVGNGISILEWTGLFTTNIVNPVQDDPDEDGVLNAGKCELKTPGEWTKAWRPGAGSDAKAKARLGESSGVTTAGYRVKAYVSDYSVGGSTQQMFNLDTAVLSHYQDATQGWEFVTIKRPSGCEVTFSLKGAKVGIPVNIETKKKYRLVKNGDNNEIHFGGTDNIVHRFNTNGVLSEVLVSPDGKTTTITGGPTNWSSMTTYKTEENLIASNVCPVYTAVPHYNADKIMTNVVYYLDGETNIVSLLPGSRIIKTTDLSNNLLNEIHLVKNAEGSEIWRGVSSDGTPAKKEIRSETFDALTGIRTIRQADILYSSGTAIDSNITVTLIKQFAWGDEVVQETAGYGTAEAQTSTYDYWIDTGNNYGRMKLAQSPDGSWTRYDSYDEKGREKIVCSAFKSSLPSVPANQCRATEYYYPGDPELAANNFPADDVATTNDWRSEERRVGKECRSRWSPYH